MYFQNHRLSKTWSRHCLKSVVSEYPSKVNMLKGPKHLWNLHEIYFIIFFHHSEEKLFLKYLPYWSLKSQGFLLTHWLPITSILFRILRICPSHSNADILKKETFSDYFVPLMESTSYFKDLQQRKDRHS